MGKYEKTLIVDCQDTVSKLVSRMMREKKREAIVMDEKDYLGIVSARDLVKKRIDNPDKTKIKSFVDRINPVKDDTPASDLLNSMLINDYKALPVQDSKGNIYLITKLDILRMVRNAASFKEKKVDDVMNFPYSITSDDSFSTARSLIRNLNLSRLPVLGKENRLEGMVDTLDLLKGIIKKNRSGRQIYSEDIKPDKIAITSLMNKNPLKVKTGQSLRGVINTMLRDKSPTAIVIDGDEVKGMITPRDILKFIGKEVKGVYVTVTGLRLEDNFIKRVVDEEVTNEVRKIGKFMEIESMILHIDRYHERGKRVKYTVKGRLITRRGMFFAGDHAWDVTKAVRGVLQKLEREVLKKKERFRFK